MSLIEYRFQARSIRRQIILVRALRRELSSNAPEPEDITETLRMIDQLTDLLARRKRDVGGKLRAFLEEMESAEK